MAEQLKMLALSPTMDKGIIARWIKQEGEKVASGDVLCEVETDKASMDYESSADGVLLKILLPEGEIAAIGDPIAIVGKEGEDISDLVDAADRAPAEAAPPVPEPSDEAEQQPSQPPVADEKPAPAVAEPSGFIRSTPLARKIADQNGLDLGRIEGSGPAGRIIKADVEKAIAVAPAGKAPEPAKAKAEPAPAKPSAAASQPSADDIVLPVTGKRRIIAQRLSESMYSAPHYYLKVPVLMDDLLAARTRLNSGPDQKVSMNAFLVKLVAEALKRHPMVNATWTGDTIVQHGKIDIGLAVAQTDGLITPVVRDCGSKGIVQIDRELKDLIDKARSNTLKPEEYTGATFTISNLGSYGIEEFTAIINPPGSAILAVGEIRKEPVVQPDDTLKVRSVMKLTLSCDHRVIDGSVGAEFLTDLRRLLEEPVRALY